MINGPALRLARSRKGLTQRGLAAACAQLGITVDPANLNRAEHGQPGAIGVKKLPAVAQALGIDDVGDLLTDHGKALDNGTRAEPQAALEAHQSP